MRPVTEPPRKATESAGPRPRLAASAVRTLTRTLTIMPMKPAAADRMAPTAKPMAVSQPRPQPCLAPSATPRMTKATAPTAVMVRYWRTR